MVHNQVSLWSNADYVIEQSYRLETRLESVSDKNKDLSHRDSETEKKLA